MIKLTNVNGNNNGNGFILKKFEKLTKKSNVFLTHVFSLLSIHKYLRAKR